MPDELSSQLWLWDLRRARIIGLFEKAKKKKFHFERGAIAETYELLT